MIGGRPSTLRRSHARMFLFQSDMAAASGNADAAKRLREEAGALIDYARREQKWEMAAEAVVLLVAAIAIPMGVWMNAVLWTAR